MTVAEAQEQARADWHWIRSRMIAHNCGDPGEPRDTWLDIRTYEYLSGDFVRPSEAQWLEDFEWSEERKELALKTYGDDYAPNAPRRRLMFWTKKYQYMRDVAEPELKSFLIDRINAARRGN